MQKPKNNDFNFYHVDEVKIYRFAIDKEVRSKRKYKKIKEKYYSYKEWEEQHAFKKYERLTEHSLSDLLKFFQRKLENEIDKDNSMSGFMYPIIITVINLYISYFSDEINNPDLKLLATIIIIMCAVVYIIKYQMFDDIAYKNLYRDYIEIIEEMIEQKKRQS